MTLLDDLRAAQHMEIRTQSDFALEDYLDELDPAVALQDLLPTTALERRHLDRIRHTTDLDILNGDTK